MDSKAAGMLPLEMRSETVNVLFLPILLGLERRRGDIYKREVICDRGEC